VSKSFESRVAAIQRAEPDTLAAVLSGGRKGIEKECLRITPSGHLSSEPHPEALGSALTNEYITTDFSEALLEFVTPACTHTWEALRSLCDIHQFTYRMIGDELLWPASMPCLIPADEAIPLARYGTSNVGRMKTVYRRGLGYRYGRHMQTIAGVHFNYSLPIEFWPYYRDLLGRGGDDESFRSAEYMGLVRNFRRFGWLLLYLCGASPALCKSFTGGGKLDMPSLDNGTWYEPYGTSLRMSDLGYSNRNQSRINISLNSVDEYIRDLSEAIRTPEPAYEKIGVRVDGEYRQLSANQLQIENEYYSPIRPKRVAMSGERPTAALQRGGVEYVEVRALDINIFDPCGINQNTMRFIEAFLVYCLLEDSPPLGESTLEEAARNQLAAARRGRDPDLLLQRDGAAILLRDWAAELTDSVVATAELIDRAEKSETYGQAVAGMRRLVDEPDATPSARILAELRATNSSFFEFAMQAAVGHRDYFGSIENLPPERFALLQHEAKDSLQRQRDIEDGDELDFDAYLAAWFADEAVAPV
jgi:glutamate--cysteine ligase